MTEQAIWEYNKGSKIKDDDIDIAMKQKLDCFNQVGKLFDKFDFLVKLHDRAEIIYSKND